MKELKVYCKHKFTSNQTYLVTLPLDLDAWEENGSEFLQEIEVPELDTLNFHAKALPGINLAVGVWFIEEDLICTPIVANEGDREVIEEAFENITKVESVPEEPEVELPDGFLKIILDDNSVVYAETSTDVTACCTTGAATANLTVNGTTFTKDQIISVEFGKDWNITTVPSNFFRNCTNLISLSKIPSMITNMGPSFLYGCTSFNQLIVIPKDVTGTNCLRGLLQGCTLFNQPIVIPEGVTGSWSLDSFLYGCTSFNHPITIPNGVTGLACLSNFLRGCTSFNQPITIPNGVTGEGCLQNFLYGCTSFNQPITIPEGVTGNICLSNFLQNCTSFNQPIIIPSGVNGNSCLSNFLSRCTSLNSSITIPSNVTGEYCLSNFLDGCTSFNQPITIPEGVVGEGCLNSFLTGCTSFNQPITISEGLRGYRVINHFLYNCHNYTNIITVFPDILNIDTVNVSDNTLSTNSNTAPMYVEGVKIAGLDATQFAALQSKFQLYNRTTSPFRKLVRV